MPYIIETGLDTLEEQLDERERTLEQLYRMLGWAVSDRTKALVNARITEVESEIEVMEEELYV